MRCLVTGASGFLGSHLVRRLLRDGHQVLVVARENSNLWRIQDVRDNISFACSSLSGIQSVGPAINDFHPEIAFHFAWTGGNSSKFANGTEQIFANIPGSLDLANLLADAGCRGLIYAGSSLEYGEFQIPARETDLLKPVNLYGTAKFATELILQGLCRAHGIRFCGLRIFWTYGPMDDSSRMIPAVISALLAGKKFALTEGAQMWDFLYVDDAIEAVSRLSNIEDASGIFNLGSGRPVTVRHAVELIRDAVNPAIEIEFGSLPYSPNQVMHLEADISRLKTATGWTPQIDLEEGIRRTVDWYRTRAEYAK